MGLWECLRQWQRGRLVAGVTASLLVHVLLAWCVLWGLKGELQPHWVPKRGDTIIVELPKPEEPASAGSPTAPPAAVRPPAPPPAPSSTVTSRAPPAAPAPPPPPPPPARPPAPPPAPSSTVRSTPPPAPPPREERRVAVAP